MNEKKIRESSRVEIDLEAFKVFDLAYRKDVKKQQRIDFPTFATLQIGFSVAVWPLALPLANYFMATATMNKLDIQNKHNETLANVFNSLQATAYEKARQNFIKDVDRKVSFGGRITEDVLAKLAACPTKALEGASARLRLSVLQARQAINGQNPATFKDLNLNPLSSEAKASLLDKLLESDKALDIETQQGYTGLKPEIANNPFGSGKKTEPSFLHAAWDLCKFITYEGVVKGSRISFAKAPSLMDLPKSFVVPELLSVKDMKDKLDAYEASTGRKLDMPAVHRGPKIF